MNEQILDGKLFSQLIKDALKEKIALLELHPELHIITVGDDSASQVYVNTKKKACEYCGIKVSHKVFSKDITEEALCTYMANVKCPTILQLPVPKHINAQHCIDSLNPEFDADGFHTVNLGKLFSGNPGIIPATPAGIMTLLKEYHIPLEGKNAVVIGRSNIVGKPIAQLLTQANANVTLLHSKTSREDLRRYTLFADIIVCAIGKPRFLSRDLVNIGTTVIDVGINRVPSDNEKGYKIVGDFDSEFFENVETVHYTPVPGGIGPMTVASLLQNVVTIYEQLQSM